MKRNLLKFTFHKAVQSENTSRDLPQALCDKATRLDAQKSVVGGRDMKRSPFGVSEERIWPPNTAQHLVTNAQLVLP